MLCRDLIACEVFVPLQLERRVHPALHQRLIAAEADGFFDLLVNDFRGRT